MRHVVFPRLLPALLGIVSFLHLSCLIAPAGPASASAVRCQLSVINADGQGTTDRGQRTAGEGLVDVRELKPGVPVASELKSGEVHRYQIPVVSGHYLHVVVDHQPEILVVVTLLSPDRQELVIAEGCMESQERQRVSMLAEVTGTYLLEVRLWENKQSLRTLYRVSTVELRAATPEDKSRISAWRAYGQVAQSYSVPTFMPTYTGVLVAPYSRAMQQKAPRLVNLDQEAAEKYKEVLSLFRAAGDRPGQARTLNNIAFIYYAASDYQKALEFLDSARTTWRAVGDERGEAITLHNLGGVYRLLGDDKQALEYYGEARQISKVVGYREGEAETLHQVAVVWKLSGDYERGLEYYSQARALWRGLHNLYREVTELSEIAGIYNRLGEKRKALNYCREFTSTEAQDDKEWEAGMLQAVGVLCRLSGDLQRAVDYFNRALLLWPATGDPLSGSITLRNLGFVYSSMSEPQKALAYFRQALTVTRDLGERDEEAALLMIIARIERDQQDLVAARIDIEAALETIESQRTRLAGQELRASQLGTFQGHYKFYIDLLMRMHERKPSEGHDATALEASERARARGLLETLAESRADIRLGVDRTLLKRARTFQQQLNALEWRRVQVLSGKHTEEQAAAAERALRVLLGELQQVEAQIRVRSPRYAALIQPKPLRLREIQQQVLDEESLLLEYSLGDERSYLWAVTPTSITTFTLPKQAEIETAARRAYELMSTGNSVAAKAQAEIAAAHLSQMLIGPVAEKLGKRRLLIVTDGVLRFIPFGALPSPAPGRRSSIDDGPRTSDNGRRMTNIGQPLVVDHEIIDLPSASVLGVLRRELAGREQAKQAVAVLADPVFDREDERVKGGTEIRPYGDVMGNRRRNPSLTETRRIGDTASVPASGPSPILAGLPPEVERSAKESGLTSFPRLRFTRREAEAITALVPEAKKLKAVDFAASRATATSGELGQYRVVHFATHGLLNSQHPELSGIVLSLVDEKGQPQDGFLRAHEIYNLNLPADLVVLSGCQTALGKEIKGEGLISLTRGFLYAGAARVMVSLWNISDEATAELMKRFYRGMLKDGLRPAAALRAAQVSMWREKRWEAPYYWAAFILQGEWR